jgi:hypothetical protein
MVWKYLILPFLNIYCSDVFGAKYTYANSKVYLSVFSDRESGLKINYFLEPMSYNDYNNDPAFNDALIDVLNIAIKNINAVNIYDQYSSSFAIHTREYPMPEFSVIHYDTILFGNKTYRDVYSEADSTCNVSLEAQDWPCRMLYKKGKGVVAIEFPENKYWYALE